MGGVKKGGEAVHHFGATGAPLESNGEIDLKILAGKNKAKDACWLTRFLHDYPSYSKTPISKFLKDRNAVIKAYDVILGAGLHGRVWTPLLPTDADQPRSSAQKLVEEAEGFVPDAEWLIKHCEEV